MTTPHVDALSAPSAPVHLHGPADLVAAVPYLLGFTPQDCLVAAFLRGADGELVITARVDHPAVDDYGAFIDAWRRMCADITAANDVDRLVLVDFCTSGRLVACGRPEAADDAADDEAAAVPDVCLTHAMAAVAADAGLYVCDEIVVAGDRWRSVLCSDTVCCPVEGSAIDPERGSRVAAPFVYDGVAPVEGRGALAARVQPRPADDPESAAFNDEVSAAAEALHRQFVEGNGSDLEAQRTEVTRCAGILIGEDTHSIAPVIALLSDVRRRDALMRTLVHEVDPAERRRAEDRIVAALPLVGPELRAAAATLAAGLAWQRGDGALAHECLAVALAQDPGYSLARLLQRAISRAVPPQVWVDAVAATSVDSCLRGA